MPDRVLVVEDEATLCSNIARALARAGLTVTAVETRDRALAELEDHTFDVVVTDLCLPDGDGLAVLDRARATSEETAVLLMTAYASVDSAILALRRGAHDYLIKPLSLAELVRKVQNLIASQRLGRENQRLRALVHGPDSALSLLRGGGREMNAVCDLVERVAAAPSNVLVVGESGVGKGLVARAIHEGSARARGPFLTVDSGAIPDGLVERTLFGQERASGDGDGRREGIFRAASGGTLLLDEVGELSSAAQIKLLRAVESKEILPVGAEQPLRVDTRIVASTQHDLGRLVAEGRFREDLLYRFQIVTVRVPPLRERLRDVPALATYFVRAHARALRRPARAIAPEAVEVLARYPWPGNVRELSNVVQRAVILCDDETITAADLPHELGGPGAVAETNGTESGATGSSSFVAEGESLEHAVQAFQRDHIARVLDRVRGSREAAARALGLSPATFYRHLQRHGLKGYRLDGAGRRQGEETR